MISMILKTSRHMEPKSLQDHGTAEPEGVHQRELVMSLAL
jgi:hypothetical protein